MMLLGYASSTALVDSEPQKADFYSAMSNAVTTAEAERDLSSVQGRPPPREYTVTVIRDGKVIPESEIEPPPGPPLEPYTMIWDGERMVPSRPLTGAEIAERMSRPDWKRLSPDLAEEWANDIEENRRIYNVPSLVPLT